MAIFRSTPPPLSQHPTSSMRLPASKRISLAASQRLSTITEGNRDVPTPTIPLRSVLRLGHRGSVSTTQHPALRSQETLRVAPPAYGAVHGSSIAESEDLTAPVEGEKLARLRREGPQGRSRGGWRRLLLVLVILLVVIGLAVGLGVGLTVGRRSNNSSDNGGTTSGVSNGSTTPSKPQFPLGEYSFVTALRVQQMDCTSRAAAWNCPPYSTFASSNTSSLATFNWIISNTSAQYAVQSSGITPSSGVTANLSISTTNNPFAISFSNQSLTYISESGNSSSARYSFSFTMPRAIAPDPPITSNGQASKCFFNSTVLTGNIYLNSSRTYPDVALRSSESIGGYAQWPYAVEISEVSPGGANIPDCYETVNGVISDRIINGFTPQSASSQCICAYRNF